MTKQSDENRDEDVIEEKDFDEIAAAEAEDVDPASDPEEEEESEEEPEEEEPEDEEEKDKFVMPEKFKGKSAEDIAKAYQNLEGMIGEKAQEMAQKILSKKGGVKVKPADMKDDEEFDLGLSDEEIAKMTPKEFGRLMNRKISEKATEIAKNAIERSNEVKASVSREIKEATKAHPHLKENKEYREVVLSIIEAASAKGNVVTLKEACEKADKALGVVVTEKKDEAPKKKPKTAVEKNDGSDGQPVKSDEDRVKEGMMGAGMSTGMLGGLGV